VTVISIPALFPRAWTASPYAGILRTRQTTRTGWPSRGRAQQIRWAAFEERLSINRLRAYLKGLPDFDDVLAEEKAMAYGLAFPGFTSALHFFVECPTCPMLPV